MPFDSNGNYTLPDTYFVENGDTVLPIQHNPPLEDIAVALSSTVLRSGVAPMSGDLKMGTKKVTGMGDGTATTDAVTKGQLDLQSIKFATKSANYTAVASDRNTTFRFTGPYTFSLDDAATLGASWSATVIASGGSVTIDPDALETINGLATLSVPNGATAEIICDGTSFFTIIRSSVWELVRTDTFSGANTYSVTGLGAYERVRIRANIKPSSPAAVNLRTSSNNGSSYDNGGSDYDTLLDYATSSGGGTPGGNFTTASSISLTTGNSVSQLILDLTFDDFNKSQNGTLTGDVGYIAGALVTGNMFARRIQATARNAFQLIGGANISGTIIIKGVRG